MYCQLETLRRCFPTVIRRTLDKLPETLDETYERTLLGIEKEKREFAHRLFQCLIAAVRPLHIDELAGVLAIRFDAGEHPQYHADWRSEDSRDAVLSACSSLIVVVGVDGSPLVQFSHFSVKEFLTSGRLSESGEKLSHFHVSLKSAHTILAKASLSILLSLGSGVDKNSIEGIPFARYAAQHWIDHSRFEDVSSCIEVRRNVCLIRMNHLLRHGFGSTILTTRSGITCSRLVLHHRKPPRYIMQYYVVSVALRNISLPPIQVMCTSQEGTTARR